MGKDIFWLVGWYQKKIGNVEEHHLYLLFTVAIFSHKRTIDIYTAIHVNDKQNKEFTATDD